MLDEPKTGEWVEEGVAGNFMPYSQSPTERLKKSAAGHIKNVNNNPDFDLAFRRQYAAMVLRGRGL